MFFFLEKIQSKHVYKASFLITNSWGIDNYILWHRIGLILHTAVDNFTSLQFFNKKLFFRSDGENIFERFTINMCQPNFY